MVQVDRTGLIVALSSQIPHELARDLVDSFLEIRHDVATSTLGRATPGKFVETVVQILQYLIQGNYRAKPKVDEFLRNIESSASDLDDGLRICAARIARAMYTLRSKRSIAHKNRIDPNIYDLRFLLSCAQWILAELVRLTSRVSVEEAGQLIERIITPIGGLVEDFGGKRLVHGNLTVREEILVLLRSYYPTERLSKQITEDLDRRSAGTVRTQLRAMWKDKLVEGNGTVSYRLTQTGLREAIAIINRELGT